MSIHTELLAAPKIPLRYLVRFNPRPTATKSDESCYLPMEAISQFGAVDFSRMRPTSELAQGYSFLADGDVAYAKVTPCFENGKGLRATALPGGHAFATTEVTVMRPSSVLDSRYLAWILQSADFRAPGEAHMSGAGGLKRVPESYAARFRVPRPNLDVQRAIVDYLDRETAQIDAFIAKNEELITLLTERRAAAVNAPFAVQRPNTRLQHACEAIVDCPHTTPEIDDDGDFEAVRTASVRDGVYVPGQGLTVSEATWRSRNGSLGPRPGDVLFTREAPAGEACMVPSGEICLGQRMVLLRIDSAKADGQFLLWQLYSREVQSYFELAANGSTVTNIRLPLLRSAPIWLPSLEEQRSISGQVAEQVGAIDDAIGIARRGIALARERRAALISAAVTGKIDVGVAA
ncbi:hypothetical protein ACTJKO_11450 [Curtobacterium sp. 22159]|uniref:hypothetical protein n=1 Tax=Curtobacterium sp. 22159 TaxID=3453882 RepID=UPI003F83061A